MNKKEYIKIIIEETLSEYNCTLDDSELNSLSENIENGLSVYTDYTYDKQYPIIKNNKDIELQQHYDFLCLLGDRYGFTDFDVKRKTIGIYENIMGRQCSNTIHL